MITVTILTKNSQRHIGAVLEVLSSFDEVLLLDNGSTDDTLAIAVKFANVRVEKSEFIGFGALHNKVSALAKHDWILSIDSDEVATPELVSEILALKLDERSVYSISRQNYYRGKAIFCCSWSPDRVLRLYNRKSTKWSDDAVHERVLTDGLAVVQLKNKLNHYSYENLEDFLSKMQSYTTLYARQNAGKKSSSPLKAILHAKFAFIKCYVLKLGFLQGYEGFAISSYNAITAFYKYMKLYEANMNRKQGR